MDSMIQLVCPKSILDDGLEQMENIEYKFHSEELFQPKIGFPTSNNMLVLDIHQEGISNWSLKDISSKMNLKLCNFSVSDILMSSLIEEFNIEPTKVKLNQYSCFQFKSGKQNKLEMLHEGKEDVQLGKRLAMESVLVTPDVIQPIKKSIQSVLPCLYTNKSNLYLANSFINYPFSPKKESECLSDAPTLDSCPVIETTSDHNRLAPHIQKKRLIQQKLRSIVSESFSCKEDSFSVI